MNSQQAPSSIPHAPSYRRALLLGIFILTWYWHIENEQNGRDFVDDILVCIYHYVWILNKILSKYIPRHFIDGQSKFVQAMAFYVDEPSWQRPKAHELQKSTSFSSCI